MKAVLHEKYGSPDVLILREIAKPTPQDDEVLVKVHMASANPLDWHLMRGEPFLARLEAGLTKPKHPQLGADLAGTVEAVGSNITQFQVGDEVFGSTFNRGLGSFAEYVCTSPEALALKPINTSFEEAAAVPIAALTALQGLRDKGNIQSGQKVLINGASGGVGTYAVQIAKSYGTEVTGVCSTCNLEMVQSIGADHVIDYTKDDFCDGSQQYDLIFDAVGNRSVNDMKRALTPNGIASIAGFTTLRRLFEHIIWGRLSSIRDNQQIGLMETAKTTSEDLEVLRDLLQSGKVKSIIDRCYPLNETADAIRYLETSRAKGKVVIQIHS